MQIKFIAYDYRYLSSSHTYITVHIYSPSLKWTLTAFLTSDKRQNPHDEDVFRLIDHWFRMREKKMISTEIFVCAIINFENAERARWAVLNNNWCIAAVKSRIKKSRPSLDVLARPPWNRRRRAREGGRLQDDPWSTSPRLQEKWRRIRPGEIGKGRGAGGGRGGKTERRRETCQFVGRSYMSATT